jgi:hypothetical protein
MLKISILMYDSVLHNDTGVNRKVPLAYLPLKEEDCARARFRTVSGFLLGGGRCGSNRISFRLVDNRGEEGLQLFRAFWEAKLARQLHFSSSQRGYIRCWLRSTRIHLDLKTLVEEGDHNEVATDLFLPDGVICEWLRTRIEYPTESGD